MFPVFEKVSETLIDYIQDRCMKGCNPIEVKDLYVRFTLDVVAGSAMGIEGNCFSGDSSPFKQFSQTLLSAGTISAFKAHVIFTYSFVGNLLGFK